jgi:hypothetical protein
MRRFLWLCGWTLVLLLVLGLPGSASAGDPNQVALVIQFDQDRVETRCIAFEGDTITGQEMLARSGLDVVIDATRGMGITVCRVEGVGCDFPAEHCFCQCMGGGPCAYWNYFYRDPDSEGWVYSPLGAALRKATPGSVEAWVWGDGHTPPADDLTFDALCAVPTPTAPTPTPQLATQMPASPTPIIPEATPTLAPTQAPPQAPAPSSTPAALPPTPAPTPSPRPNATGGLSSYLPFGLVGLAMLIIGAIVWLRR